MKKSKFSDSQIMGILKQAEAGIPAPSLCREHGMSNAIFKKKHTQSSEGLFNSHKSYLNQDL